MHHKPRGNAGRWLSAVVAALLGTLGLAAVLATTSAQAAGAVGISTTTNTTSGLTPGNGACLQGGVGDAVNCNHYTAKEDVWLSGLPGGVNLPDGDYYFAVLSPGGQPDTTDGAPDLLSTDTMSDRTFNVTGGVITNLGTHQFINSKLQLAPYADTTNNGGVYIAAVCSLDTGRCKYDAFKVEGSTPVGPSGSLAAEKTANPTHTRTVTWTIGKLVDNTTSETISQAGPVTLHYSVAVTKRASETYGVTGTITVTNTTDTAIPVTIVDTSLVPDVTGVSCTLDSTGSVVVPAQNPTTLDPGTQAVNYTCTFPGDAPDGSTSYTNTATVSYTDGLGTAQVLPVASDPFSFPNPTLTAGSYEQITVSDPNGVGFPKTTSTSVTWTYDQTVSNRDCADYRNTATIDETGQSSNTTVATVCGPNSGGLTMGWWQNKNGQALLKANTTAACSTVNGYLPSSFTHGTATYLPDAYQQNKTYSASGYNYLTADCTNSTKNSYLPKFDLNVFSAANAAGTGTMMVEGQWLTTALDTANYTVSTSAGKPTLSASRDVLIPAALQGGTGLGLNACDSVGHLLSSSAANYPAYASSKVSITSALITLLNAINNNQAVTCP